MRVRATTRRLQPRAKGVMNHRDGGSARWDAAQDTLSYTSYIHYSCRAWPCTSTCGDTRRRIALLLLITTHTLSLMPSRHAHADGCHCGAYKEGTTPWTSPPFPRPSSRSRIPRTLGMSPLTIACSKYSFAASDRVWVHATIQRPKVHMTMSARTRAIEAHGDGRTRW